jgi:Sortase domain
MIRSIGRRRLMSAAALLLAAGGVAAVAVGRHDRQVAEPPVVTTPAPEPSVPGALTKGPLMPASPPVRVRIPALKVDTAVAGLGQEADGSMQVPPDARTVGWYTKAPTPGALGPAVLAGHVDFKGRAGTFAKLSTLRPGDRVVIARRDGTVATFAVTKVERYAKNRFPSAAVYGPIDHAGLRLITCGGDFDGSAGHYRDNVVAYAALRSAGRP